MGFANLRGNLDQFEGSTTIWNPGGAVSMMLWDGRRSSRLSSGQSSRHRPLNLRPQVRHELEITSRIARETIDRTTGGGGPDGATRATVGGRGQQQQQA